MTPVVRLLRIALELLRFELGSVMGRLMPSRSRLQSPQRFCFALARLGTTFIKFGQALSLRRDILPDDYIAALQSLQDHIAPFPAREAIREIELGLGRPVQQRPVVRGRNGHIATGKRRGSRWRHHRR